MNESPKRLILGYLPNNRCNLKCSYCYISQLKQWEVSDGAFEYPAAHIAKCLSKERLGGTCLVNLTAQGETLLYSEIVELVSGILEQGHYVELVTNATVGKRVDELLALPADIICRLEFKISFHYKELVSLGLFDKFCQTVKRIADSPASYTLELMPHDEIECDIEEIRKVAEEHFGAPCHVTVGRDDLKGSRSLLTGESREKYVEAWSVFDSEMFDFKMSLLDVKRREFCYAGAWTLWVDFSTGEARQCYGQPSNQNLFANPGAPIKFIPVGHHCVQPYCINGHAFLSLGAIPDLNVPSYYDTRNRNGSNGSWLKEPVASFFSRKLGDRNDRLSRRGQIANTLAFPFRFAIWSIRSWDETKRKIRVRMQRANSSS